MADAVPETLGERAPVQSFFHPTDSQESSRPDAKVAELRRTCPVSRAEREGFPAVTVVTKYDDVAAVFRNWRGFGNIGSDPNPTLHDATPIEKRTIIALDPPVHTWVRRLNNLAMAPAAIDKALPYIEAVASPGETTRLGVETLLDASPSMELEDGAPSAPNARAERAQTSPQRRQPAHHANGTKRKSGLVRINHALEPALRAAAHWRSAACDLERLEREHLRRRAAIIARQQRAGAQLAAFMSQTGANRRWLTELLDLPEHAATMTDKARHGDA